MTFYLLRPCSGHAAYEALLKKQVQIDLSECVGSLEENGYDVTDAKIMLVAKKGDIEISIYPSAKLLVKCQSEEEAAIRANEIYEVLGIKILL
jgi:hypothetical protein